MSGGVSEAEIQAVHEARIAVEAAATLTAACLQDLKTATSNLESMAQANIRWAELMATSSR